VRKVSGWQNAKYFKMAEFETFQDGEMRKVSRWRDAKFFRMTGFMFVGKEMF
jgi:hypothetical protein